ncbi:MAG TPA: fumarylacetoacetate hydrolase family protein [Verrucomicrobiae bacterium]|nr:fumarylacetoacetate hydrolase family protein [Verrucomicrobiae bacterium]
MKLCRFQQGPGRPRVGLVRDDDTILDLSAEGIDRLTSLFEFEGLAAQLGALAVQNLPRFALADVKLLAPLEQQEVWAVGVTYLRSKKARMDESEFSATAYDKVYDAPRPELFFKSMPEKVIGPGGAVGIRSDARWSVPEPELAFVLNSRGHIVGYTVGNDMSSRDIEGENLLYLPQAKIYTGSCALGPFVRVGATESEARTWKISLEIRRGGTAVFQGEVSAGRLKRPFEEMAGYLFRCQSFPHGAVLLTGTGIVPPDSFSLAAGDVVRISISGVGGLENTVAVV